MESAICTLERDSYFPGDVLRARIDLTPSAGLASEGTGVEWVGIQVHGQFVALDSRIALPSAPDDSEALLADFSSRRRVSICASKAWTVYSISTDKSAAMSVSFEFVLPPVLLPSYRGQYTRCVYMVTLGFQQPRTNPDQPPRVDTMHLPFKVLLREEGPFQPGGPFLKFPLGWHDHDYKASAEVFPLPAPPASKECPETGRPQPCDAHTDLNPVVHPSLGPSYASLARQSQSFTISSGKHLVCRFTILGPSVVRPGQDLTGVFDFSDASIPCAQLCAALEFQEWLKGDTTAPAGTTIVSTLHRLTTGLVELPVVFNIPMDAASSCIWDSVGITWALAFEFQVPKGDGGGGGSESETHQTLLWSLKLTVLPPPRGGQSVTMSYPMSEKAAAAAAGSGSGGGGADAGAGTGSGGGVEPEFETLPLEHLTHTRTWHVSSTRRHVRFS